MADIYGFSMKTIDGAAQPLADYRDKVLLVVNVASKCAEYSPQGFAVLGFPATSSRGGSRAATPTSRRSGRCPKPARTRGDG